MFPADLLIENNIMQGVTDPMSFARMSGVRVGYNFVGKPVLQPQIRLICSP